MSIYTQLAPAKITLYFHLTGKQHDGYHQVDSLMVFVDAGDEISYQAAADFSLTITGAFANGLYAGPDNLVQRALLLLCDYTKHKRAGNWHLTKNLPVAAGLGGGSADAAAALRLANQVWQLGLSLQELAALAAPLGSDVPACVYSQPLYASGTGAQINILENSLPDYALVLVNPNVPLATPAVYAARQGAFQTPAPLTPWPQNYAQFLAALKLRQNGLKAAAVSLCQDVGQVLGQLRAAGADHVGLCGSGATCYGLAQNLEKAQQIAQILQKNQPNWWIFATQPLKNGQI